ncbi:hypothetical protein RJ639_029784 [Escallonia herrerae]|uniref:CCHC-type domain-containing protein n=1 Tax=Escallonia herrerae TaxID=1293975 RepID=A0AA88X2P5_9ASTE|nr:hypothetical protein RJ639_029784 [Escallonia herrerae]
MEVSNGRNVHNGMEKLVGKNYKYWRMCMDAYLQGQDLWELVAGTDAIPSDVPENAESQRKWKIKCGKALFALRTSISKEFIDHVRDICSPKEVWETLERLFTKKNTARLQLLEKELAMLKQGEIDADEKISEARLRRYLVRGLKKEYGPFVTFIQGWSIQPSVKELENFLSNQEALAKQMAKSFEIDDVLFSKGKSSKKNPFGSKNKEEDLSAEKGGNSHTKKPITCFRCGKIGHIKKNCRVKLSKANVACTSEGDDQLKWDHCFTVEAIEQKSTQAFVNYADNKKEEWIIDLCCSHDVTGNDTLFSEGWRCMDPNTKKFTTSRDVVFDEVSLPFSVPKFIALGALTAEEPTSYEEARGCPNWERAMQEEIDALDKNETWELVPKPEKFKARLVARGFSQNYGLDYKETFSPVAKMVTVRSIISLAAFKGYCFNTGSTAVSWCSKKQDIVVLSSTEAEYVAATMATQECVWLKRLIGDMFYEVDYAVQIKCDNVSATKLASNPIFHARTKHIKVRYHFVREKVFSEEVELLSVRTNDQVADIFTKAWVEPKFQECDGIRNREAYYDVAEKLHPDIDKDNPEAEKKFHEVQKA